MRRVVVGICLLFTVGLSHPVAHAAPNQNPGSLHTVGAKLVDAGGQEVRVTGVNWFGLETETFAPHGLWARNYGDMLDQIAAAGFNTVRLPFSNQLFDATSRPTGIDDQKNPDLRGLTGLQIMDRIIIAAGQRGLSVILDRHRPTASSQSELWYTDAVPESRWIDDWTMLAQRYAGNQTVVGADLHNEPHGPATWGDANPATDWRLAAERAGNAILAVNPDWLIIVEGIEHFGNSDWYWWGGNLAGVRASPVRLSAPDKLVYSTHDYGPGVYQQNWFHAANFPSNLVGVWHDHWAFIQQENIAPILVGEFGGRSVGTDAEGTWQRSLLAFLRDNDLSYTYWAWNPDSGDTGGILADDWSTLDQRKLGMLSAYQWPLEAHGTPADASIETSVPSQLPVAEISPSPAALIRPQPVVVVAGTAPISSQVATPPQDSSLTAPVFAPGGPFDPDLQHVFQGVGGPTDPDADHRQAREHDERLYLAQVGQPWRYAAYVTTASGL